MKTKEEVIKALIAIARAAYNALDNSEERTGHSIVQASDVIELERALDALEELPAEPGYVSHGPNNAEYFLSRA